MIVLRYIGDGTCWIPGIPARDLTDDDLTKLDPFYTIRRLCSYHPPVFEQVGPHTPVPIVPIERAEMRGITRLY